MIFNLYGKRTEGTLNGGPLVQSNRELLGRYRGFRPIADGETVLLPAAPALHTSPAALAGKPRIFAWMPEGTVWDLMEVVARRLVRYDENDVRSTVLWATATRRTDCLAAAEVILLEAVERLPDAAALHYKLGAYEAQLGELETAKARLQHAFKLEPALRRSALGDEDLRPIWDWLRK